MSLSTTLNRTGAEIKARTTSTAQFRALHVPENIIAHYVLVC